MRATALPRAVRSRGHSDSDGGNENVDDNDNGDDNGSDNGSDSGNDSGNGSSDDALARRDALQHARSLLLLSRGSGALPSDSAVRRAQGAFLAVAALNVVALAVVAGVAVGTGGSWPGAATDVGDVLAAAPHAAVVGVAPLLLPAGVLTTGGASGDANAAPGAPRFMLADVAPPGAVGTTGNALAAGIAGSARVWAAALYGQTAFAAALLCCGGGAVWRRSQTGLSAYIAATLVVIILRLTGAGVLLSSRSAALPGTPYGGVDAGAAPGFWALTRLLLDCACVAVAARLRSHLLGGAVTSLRWRSGL